MGCVTCGCRIPSGTSGGKDKDVLRCMEIELLECVLNTRQTNYGVIDLSHHPFSCAQVDTKVKLHGIIMAQIVID